MSKRNGQYKICIICGKEYYIRANRAEASKYCSRECWNKRRVLKKCEHCGNNIESYFGNKYCSRKCSHDAMIGEKAPRWIDGKSMGRDRARDAEKIRQWRKKVFMRDYYTCKICGVKRYLHAHHIIEWAKDESKRFDIDNGQTLCIDCHGARHGKDFNKKLRKHCSLCGKAIKRESQYCHSCSTKEQWKRQKRTA